MTTPQGLVDKAQTLATGIAQAKMIRESREQSDAFAHRLADVRLVHLLAASLVVARRLLETHGPVAYPKRSLAARTRSLSSLLREFEEDPKTICEPKAFDRAAFEELLNDIKTSVLSAWRRSLTPDSRATSIASAIEDDPAEATLSADLKACIGQLTAISETLPASQSILDEAGQLREKVEKLCDEVEKRGYDKEIGDFLRSVRSPNGVPLSTVLASKKILTWLEGNNRAKLLRVVRPVTGPTWR